MSAQDEIDLLQQEGEMSIEDLGKMYSSMVVRHVRPRTKTRVKQNILQQLQHRRLLALVGHVLAIAHKCRMWKPC
jgi:hypothetical protein